MKVESSMAVERISDLNKGKVEKQVTIQKCCYSRVKVLPVNKLTEPLELEELNATSALLVSKLDSEIHDLYMQGAMKKSKPVRH